MRATARPLDGMTILEVSGDGTPDVVRVALAFAGLLAVRLGGAVHQVGPAGGDPLAGFPPLLPDGSSALARFLNRGKVRGELAGDGRAALLSGDAALAQSWSRGPAVLVTPASGGAGGPTSELTILAASGLLDIYGEVGKAPLPLPGHQAAYSAGLAAFSALLAACFAARMGGSAGLSRVSVTDTAMWLNWKHYLAAHTGQAKTGIGRPEDWVTYPCRDGFVAVVFQDKDVPKLAALIGDERLLEPKFATLAQRRENLPAFRAIVAPWVRARTRAEIVGAARRTGIPIGPVLAVGELLDDAQMRARDFIDLEPGSPAAGEPALPAQWLESA